LPGRRQTLRRKCDRRSAWAHSAATLASHAEEAGSQALAPTQRRSVLSIPRQSGRTLIPSPLVQVQPNPAEQRIGGAPQVAGQRPDPLR
jgi:hypothetical protein